MDPKQINLSFKDAESDKVYHVSLEKSSKLFVVNFAYGKRGGNLKEGTKTPEPVAYDKALAIYEKLVKSKTDKSYVAEGLAKTTNGKAKTESKVKVKTKVSSQSAIQKSESVFLLKENPNSNDGLFQAILEQVDENHFKVFTYSGKVGESLIDKERTIEGGCNYKKAKSIYNGQVNKRLKTQTILSVMDPSWNKELDVTALVKELKTLIDEEQDVITFLKKLSNDEKASLEADVRAMFWPIQILTKFNASPEKQLQLIAPVAIVFLTRLEMGTCRFYIDRQFEDSNFDKILPWFVPNWFGESVVRYEMEYFKAMEYAKNGYWDVKSASNKFGANIFESIILDDGKTVDFEKLFLYPETLETHLFNLFHTPPVLYKGFFEKSIQIFPRLLKEKKIDRKKLLSHLLNQDIKKEIHDDEHALWCLEIATAINTTPSELESGQEFILEHVISDNKELDAKICELLTVLIEQKKIKVDEFLIKLKAHLPLITNANLVLLLPVLEKLIETNADATPNVMSTISLGLKHKKKNVVTPIQKFFKKHDASTLVVKVNTQIEEENKPKPITDEDLGSLSLEQIEKVSQLLLSADDGNTKVAFAILENQEFPKILLTEIFSLYKITSDKKLKQRALDILNQHGSKKLKDKLESKLSLGEAKSQHMAKEKTIKENIIYYVEGNELDGLKLAQALYKKHGVGVTYLLQEAPEERQMEMFQTFVDGSKLKLNGMSLTKLPPAIFEFPALTEIDLSNNKLGSLPAKIGTFTNLRVLNVGQNKIKTINKNIKKLTKLEELYLNDNVLKDGVPAEVFELSELRVLDLTQSKDDKRSHIMPDNITNLKKLEVFKLDYCQYRQVRECDAYSNYPQIKEVTGKPIDLEPLTVAETAFDQGDLSPVSYVLKNGDSRLIKKVLDHYYDPKKKSFDFTRIYLEHLPKEILDYEVKVLDLTRTQLGSDKLYTDLDYKTIDKERTALIAELKQLEALTIDGCGLRGIADLSGLVHLKKLIIDNYKLNELFDFTHFQKLEELILDGMHLKELPKGIFTLKNLKKLKLIRCVDYDGNNRPTGEDFEELKNLTKLELFGLRISFEKEDKEYKTIGTYLPKGCVYEPNCYSS